MFITVEKYLEDTYVLDVKKPFERFFVKNSNIYVVKLDKSTINTSICIIHQHIIVI